MKLEVTISVDNQIDAYANSIKPGLRSVVQKTGFDMVAIEQGLSRRDTGAMANGWGFDMVGDLEGENYNPVPYTPHHEYGTVKMSAQPMLHPALDQVRPGFEAAVAEVLRRG